MENIIFMDMEFVTFFIIEILLFISYLFFYRYSRNHKGAFDRRVTDRRCNGNSNWNFSDRRIADVGFGSVSLGIVEGNDIFEISTDRRIRERRMLIDRRRS